MSLRRFRRWLPAAALATLALYAGDGRAQLHPGENAAATLTVADATKTSDHPAFVATLSRLAPSRGQMSPAEQMHLAYLEAWQLAYAGDHAKATPALARIADQAPDKVLRLRATATLVNILGVGRHYQDAFVRLDAMVAALPGVEDDHARYQALAEAAQLLIMAGQYDLARDYAARAIAIADTPSSICKSNAIDVHALYRGGRIDGDDSRFTQWVAECEHAGELIAANELRADIADSAIRRGHPLTAISLLDHYYASVLHDAQPMQVSQYEALLARAQWQAGNTSLADRYALAAIHSSVPGEFSDPYVSATETAYLVAKKRGDWRSATLWLERHAEADKAHLDDVGARALAYQMVKQEVAASRTEADTLDKQNQILHLQREADKHDAETSRLYFLLSLMTTGGIVLWLIRTRRSQRRFMRLARHDSLTGISNRQHFVDQCTAALVEGSRIAEPIALVLFDLDHFKQINDTHGHAEGDWVLLRVAAECRDCLGDDDVFGRLGGEEFAVLLRNATKEQARERAERMRVAIGEPSGEHRTIVRATASFGVASTTTFGYDLDRLLMKADEAMYAAKAAGRDQVTVAT
ncbi:GGDEF domain-containing protein [Luteibacter aegosomatissinici]|uniref:GGDEF domain-containing protein n=1 Tax=Luteibacter aegosomatissinici TaxID=2911539 RepID=UPI001FF80095|nr:GGDEF domain-containing protein [Luteibacter aegosomatissinici]UPG94151.1 GGDEF domain-containing protein [Luteibacter aegosomatissinici]